MTQIRIAHITTIDLSLRYLLLNQLTALQQAGYSIIGISTAGPDVPVIESAGIRHIPVAMTRNFTPLADLGTLWHLYRVMRRERFTIVHTHTPKPGLLGQVAARLAGVPIVVNTLHGFYFHDRMPWMWRRFYILMERIAAQCSDVILSQNHDDIQTAIRERICPPEKIKFLGNGIDLERFDRARLDPRTIQDRRRQWNIPEDALVIGFVGRLVREKGVLELMQAMQQVLSQIPNTRLLVIGPVDGEKRDALTPAIAQEYGIAHACIFTGLQTEMPEFYALMDLFVLPSYREGFPRTPMEASAMGVPCIVTDIRGCRETVENGRNGLLVPLYDNPALVNAMLELLTDRNKATHMGMEGRRIAIERFDERQVFVKVKAEYARLLAECGLSAQ